jgi:hypothetical protein
MEDLIESLASLTIEFPKDFYKIRVAGCNREKFTGDGM